MNKNFSYYLSKYLKDYLIVERNLSLNTIRSYKNTFQSLIDYLVNKKNFSLTEITFQNITREIIIDFLNYLETSKGNTTRTRNQRLAAIKAFYKYCALNEIQNIDNITKILSIKSKKFPKKVIDFLTEEELEELLNKIDTTSKIGRRDLTILTLLYDTGARANEIISLKYSDIHLENKYVVLNGKGNKQRVVPIMEQTKKLLIKYTEENNIYDGYLLNNKKNKMGETIIKDILNKYTDHLNKNISPHTMRHSRAIHLLDNGVNIVYIKEFLGHSSIETTMEYTKIIEKSKFEAINNASTNNLDTMLDDWNNDEDLLGQLLNL